jgi:hypothetical protein
MTPASARVVCEAIAEDGSVITVKRCRICKEQKPLATSFHKDRSKPDGFCNRCKECNRDHAKRGYEKTPRSKKLEWERLHHYGISQEQYDAMFAAQDGRCAICPSTGTVHGKLFVDHCHQTDVVRGLLCGNCNSGIGQLGDDIERLKAAIRYLENHANITPARPPRKRRAPLLSNGKERLSCMSISAV